MVLVLFHRGSIHPSGRRLFEDPGHVGISCLAAPVGVRCRSALYPDIHRTAGTGFALCVAVRADPSGLGTGEGTIG